MNKKKIILVLFVLAVIIALVFLGVWFLNLQNNSKMKNEPLAPPLAADEFLNGQKYKKFASKNFDINYPDWPNLDLKNIPDAEKIKIAVTNQGCVFMVKIAEIAAGATFKENTEKLLDSQAAKISKVLVKEIGDRQAHFEAEVAMGSAVMKNISYTYLTSDNKSAGFAFIAENGNFDKACGMIVGEVEKSVVVK